jgi:CHAD domain-containing protein
MKGGELSLREKENFSDGIHRILDALHDEGAKHILARSRQHISVHELRKNIKKIRAILRLIRHEIGNDKYHELNKLYRELAGEIAILRDDTSQIELLEGMRARVHNKSISRTISKAVNQVKKKRKKNFDDFYKEKRHKKVYDHILNCKEEVQKLEINGNPDLVIMKSLKRIHSRARSAMEISGFMKSDEIYHYWRKQVKYLMYQMTILSIAWPAYFKAYISELNKLSSLLGKLHDLNLFNEHIHEERLIVLKPVQKRIMLKYIYRRRSDLKKKIEKIGAKVFSESSEAFCMRMYDFWLNSTFSL